MILFFNELYSKLLNKKFPIESVINGIDFVT